MSKIYIVFHGVHYEGTDNICAFTSEKAAKDFVAACEAHHAKKPDYPCGEYDEKAYDRYEREDKRWREAHPGGEAAASAENRTHFMRCRVCGEWLDCRDLDEVFQHEDHQPHPDIPYSGVKCIQQNTKLTGA